MLTTAYRLHAVLMKAYSWHAVLMKAFDSISNACSSIKSIQSTQSEQLTRISQCLFALPFSLTHEKEGYALCMCWRDIKSSKSECLKVLSGSHKVGGGLPPAQGGKV